MKNSYAIKYEGNLIGYVVEIDNNDFAISAIQLFNENGSMNAAGKFFTFEQAKKALIDIYIEKKWKTIPYLDI